MTLSFLHRCLPGPVADAFSAFNAMAAIGALGALAIMAASAWAQDDPRNDSSDASFYTQESINEFLPRGDPPANLQTPQACVEFFVLACRESNYERAAQALNFRLLGDISPERAAIAAERLYFVLNQELWINWEDLPDRPDGMMDVVPLGGGNEMTGVKRRSIRLGIIEARDREIPVRVHRVRPEGGENVRGVDGAVWLFSPQTVDNIDILYEAHGPGWLDQYMPDWSRTRVWGRTPIWKWLALLITVIVAPLMGYAIAKGAGWLLRFSPMPDAGLYKSVQWPLAAVIATGLVYATIQLALSLPGQVASFLDPIVLVILVFVAAWAVMRVVRFLVENLAKGAVRRVHEEDEVDRQRMLTQVTVVRHVLTLLVVVVALGVVLAQLNIFRSLGIALISSAGAAAVVLGIAGHAVLGNLIAGLQIALTQPLRLNDSVYIEDNWGRIEDITYTYVVVRTWDFRRLVIPIKYFINNWFENWSLTDPFLTKPIYLHVDYRADVQAIREKFLELVKADDDWDREHDDPQVLVYETKDQTLLVRLTCGAADPSTAWDLHCRVREQLVAWLQGVEDGRWLPRQRVDVASTPSERAPGER